MYRYAATLFQPRGTIAPPRPAPSLPTIDLVPDGWPARAAMSGPAGRVSAGVARVIFGPPSTPLVAFDFSHADYLRICGGPSCDGKTVADFRGVPAAPAAPEFH